MVLYRKYERERERERERAREGEREREGGERDYQLLLKFIPHENITKLLDFRGMKWVNITAFNEASSKVTVRFSKNSF